LINVKPEPVKMISLMNVFEAEPDEVWFKEHNLTLYGFELGIAAVSPDFSSGILA
jgi:hypothetical protein